MAGRLAIRARGDSDELRAAALAVEDEVWSPLGFLNHTEAHRQHYDALLDEYDDLQLLLLDEDTGETLALANCVPARWSFGSEMPAEGWDWLVASGGRASGRRNNVLGALAISVPDAHRGRGYATRMIREMKALVDRHGFDALIAPVRPSSKCRHPGVPTERYVEWSDEAGRCFDPWLRSHLSQGGTLVGVCTRSMVVHQHLAFWETWAGRSFERSGPQIVEGALVPVAIDLERQTGLYEEPNVWVAYRG